MDPAVIVTREVGATAKGSPLTNEEVDQNFINLRDKIQEVAEAAPSSSDELALVYAIALG